MPTKAESCPDYTNNTLAFDYNIGIAGAVLSAVGNPAAEGSATADATNTVMACDGISPPATDPAAFTTAVTTTEVNIGFSSQELAYRHTATTSMVDAVFCDGHVAGANTKTGGVSLGAPYLGEQPPVGFNYLVVPTGFSANGVPNDGTSTYGFNQAEPGATTINTGNYATAMPILGYPSTALTTDWGNGYVLGSTIPANNTWPTTNQNDFICLGDTEWSGPSIVGSTLSFALPATYNITGFHLWNGNLPNWGWDWLTIQQGLKTITVDFSTTGINGPFSGAQTVTCPQSSGAVNDPGSTVALTATSANAVRFTLTATGTYNITGGGTQQSTVSLNCIRFIRQ